MHATTTHRRALVATATTLALSATALLGAVAPASAADPTTITGRVTFPAGHTVVSYQVVAFAPGARGIDSHISGQVGKDGTFELDGLTAGTGYQLMFLDSSGEIATGYYKAGATEVPLPSSATLVKGGATGITIPTVAASTVSLTIVGPGDGEEPSWRETFAPVLVDTERNRPAGIVASSPDESGAFVIGGAFPGASYRFVLPTAGPDDLSLDGYYYAGNGYALAPSAAAVSIKAGSTGLKAFVAGPSGTTPAVTGTAKVASKLTAGAVPWSSPSTTSYQWLRDGAAISGATSSAYTLAAADLGKKVSVRAVAHPSSPTLGAVAVTSAATAPVAAGPSAVVKSAPRVSGTAAVGKKLTASAGSWSLSGVSASYQWLRGGKPIAGATKSSYTVTTSDVGARLSVRVTAKVAGRASSSATSSSTGTVAKVRPTVAAKLSKSSAKRGSTVKVTVTVRATGISRPTGTVTVKVGTKTVKKTVKASAQGKVTITLPKQTRKATYKVTASFSPSGTTAKVATKATAKPVKLTIA
ncbi:Ig-like domain repeat protein [Cellulomonas sp. PhB150]|uniref:Ig-like domain repeat protein n=1 Tax=Cellulomonas sp. PhB150 TaxID=2485188 RepID=UPI000F461E73|nr:Ig-like domain repeat protein [Cellulomonas sp. PhB150]ROS21750.1 Ig-like domain-containing protein [Cellulomonas sp. PhB150]